jgi:hypothetical protein
VRFSPEEASDARDADLKRKVADVKSECRRIVSQGNLTQI